ncbi:MAG: hypothetical protein IPJ08_09220 [Burkholderiales bacterium]|nr:hypothetical protein [Burkholderiales bacterium]
MNELHLLPKNLASTRLGTAACLAAVLILAGCGGGGGADPATGGQTDGTAGSGGTSGSGQAAQPAACTSTALADVWLDKRVGCLSEGAVMIDISSSATGTTLSQYSFVINQMVYDNAFNNVLGSSKGRHYARILCVKNAPNGLTDSFNRLSLATDLLIAFRKAAPTAAGSSTMRVEGGNQAGWVEEACDVAKHPIIVDFATRKIVAVTPAAIAAVSIFDL